MGNLTNNIPILLTQKELRDRKRYSQHQMAEGTGLTDSAISRILHYKTLDKVPFDSIVKVAKWLEVNPLDLIEESED
ncbi:MAG: helix-turn-helix transcriptional regulator [Anaerolineae bacterium]|nr:helix-turn-helix transcriptional regulator [Anaerolineae bacterium]MDQ7035351.1 helix-turn-helix transcriptional regulator [Anaerolineae bacterium]